jgi:4-aminobutyrate aminotransferase/(S)-3-amino-2-methylpropionate transaminase
LLDRANELGERFAQRSREWQQRWAIVGETRGMGAMRAIELVRSRETREAAKQETEKVMQYCYEHGLLTISAGTYGNVLRILVPLVITDDQFAEGLGVIEAALALVCESREPAVCHTS